MTRALPLVAGAVLASAAAALGRPWVAAGLLLAGVLAVQPTLLRRPAPPPVEAPGTGRPQHRRVGPTVGRGLWIALRTVGVVLATAVSLFAYYLVLTPMGLLARLAGVRLLPAGEWRRRPPPSTAAARRTAVTGPVGAASGEGGGPRLTWQVGVALMALGALVAVLVPRVLDRSPDESAIPERLRGATYNAFDAPALADADWKDEAGAEFAEASAGLTYTPYVGNSLRDYEGRYVNVSGRQRRSYETALADAGDPVDVWFFGGSTMFGFSAQRDDHTIPSEVVRLAEAEGVAVRAHNFGSPGYVNMQETVLAAQLLTSRERPDLIVFSDGINDLALKFQQAFGGIGVTGDASDLTAFGYRRELAGALTGSDGEPAPVGPVPDIGRPPSAAAVIRSLIATYERGIEVADALGDHYGIPVAHFWQPDLFNTAELEPGEHQVVADLGLDDFEYEAIARIARSTVAQLPEGVFDLSDAFAATDEPVLTDQAHTNELGARLVAQAMYPHLRATLRSPGTTPPRP